MSDFTSVKLIFTITLVFCFTFSVFSENKPVFDKSFFPNTSSKSSRHLNSFISKKIFDADVKEFNNTAGSDGAGTDFTKLSGTHTYTALRLERTELPNVFLHVVDEDSIQVNQLESEEDSTQKREQLIANQNNPKTDNSKENSELQKKKNFPRSLLTGEKLLHIFLSDAKAEKLKKELIIYGENHVPQNFRNFYFALIDLFFQYPVIFVFVIFIFIFIINIISVILILNYTVRRKNHKARYAEVYERMYEEVLFSYIFGEIEWDKVLVRLQKIDKHRNRRILTSVLLNFHENLKGEVEKFIPEIFYNLGLYKDSLKLANSFNSYKKAQGIRELTYLYPKGAKEIVEKYVNYSDDMVRAEAQMAYIRLNQKNPFEFLSNLTKPITRWTQLSAFYMIRLYQLPVPSFSNYLYSNHPTIKNFSLQMITYFQQLENIPEILDMLNSKVERTRYLSYKAVNDLRLYEGRVSIRKRYRKETYKNKLEIIKALKNIGTEEDFQFLEIIIKSESVSLKLEACRSMYFMNQEGRERLVKMSKEPNSDIEQFIAHITDNRN